MRPETACNALEWKRTGSISWPCIFLINIIVNKLQWSQCPSGTPNATHIIYTFRSRFCQFIAISGKCTGFFSRPFDVMCLTLFYFERSECQKNVSHCRSCLASNVCRRQVISNIQRKHIMEIVYFSFHNNQNNAIASESVNNNGHRAVISMNGVWKRSQRHNPWLTTLRISAKHKTKSIRIIIITSRWMGMGFHRTSIEAREMWRCLRCLCERARVS